MWFKLATANFADKNLGTMADIAGSWGVTYTLQGNISKDNCPTTVKMNDGKTQAAVDFTATFTLGEGATLTSITAKLKSSGAQLIQVTSGISITIPAASITGDIEIIAIATGSSTGGGSEGDDNGNSGSGSTTWIDMTSSITFNNSVIISGSDGTHDNTSSDAINNWCHTPYGAIDLSQYQGKKMRITLPTMPTIPYNLGIAFYNNREFISGQVTSTSSSYGYKTIELDIPVGANQFRSTWYMSTNPNYNSSWKFKCEISA